MRAVTVWLLAVVAAWLWPAPVQAQRWPERSITLIVGWSAGGTSDITARALAREMEEYLGRPIQVTNVEGALGSIGARRVAASPPDGYTWFGGAAVHGTWRVSGQAAIGWEDFYPFLAAVQPTTVYVRADSPYRDVRDLLEAVRARPGALRYGTPGPGSNGAIFAGLLLDAAGLADGAVHVPYGGGREAGRFLLAGEIQFISVTMGDVSDWAAAGQIRPLANLYETDVQWAGVTFPSVARYFPALVRYTPINPYFGIYIPRAAPVEVLDRIADAFVHAVQQERLKKMLVEDRGFVLAPLLGQEADKVMSQIESARSWSLFRLGIAPNSPERFGIPTIENWSWPPHDRARAARPWPVSVEARAERLAR